MAHIAAGALVGAAVAVVTSCKMMHRDEPELRRTVLIDMDNTLVDFDKEFTKRWLMLRPSDDPNVVLERKLFELEENFANDDDRRLAERIMGTSGFYIEFEPMPGAIQAVREMVRNGLNVVFCTAPHPLQYESCVKEKFAWVRKYFGEEYLSRLIITRDKSIIKGAVLIDDKPKVTGACRSPDWKHVVFTRSYNVDAKETKHRLNQWELWRDVLKPIIPGKYYD
ncbi:putative 5'(3')-deoxyribonucleotidase [Porphyridium purpureum]|uniref:Putative 5'(3')-deoxyribonucleotidase n=1 Tax=Porphyridium purpureum TaxID=35688 RepID=A0A5J4Z321_PORPP|nr:putative 5'(3')-deoxyribonucleotidase [Porphyridium purpureum]|eukprot:POR6804..scf295_1